MILIYFSNEYRTTQSEIYNDYLNRHFDFRNFIKRMRRMVRELLKYNLLIDYNEAIKILRRDNSEQLRFFSHATLKRWILNE